MRLYLDSCVLIDALDGAVELRCRALEQPERLADADWVIKDLVRMEDLVGPLHPDWTRATDHQCLGMEFSPGSACFPQPSGVFSTVASADGCITA